MVPSSLAAETPFTLLSPSFIRLPQTLNVPRLCGSHNREDSNAKEVDPAAALRADIICDF
jgi:hypothetical protein